MCFAGVVVGHILGRKKIVPTNRLVNVLTLAIVRTASVVRGRGGVVIEGERVGTTFNLHFLGFALHAKREGLGASGLERETPDVQAQQGDADVQHRAVPAVPEAVDHLQREASRRRVETEIQRGCGIVLEALTFHEGTIFVGDGEADFPTPEGCGELGLNQDLV